MALDIFQRIQIGLDEKRQTVTEFLEAGLSYTPAMTGSFTSYREYQGVAAFRL